MVRLFKRQSENNRCGASAVEMAVALPIILAIFWGFWEWSRVELMRQAAATAAYEGARRGILPGAETTDMTTVATERLNPYSINNPTVTPTLNANTSRVEISIPIDQNLWGSGRFFAGKSIRSVFELEVED